MARKRQRKTVKIMLAKDYYIIVNLDHYGPAKHYDYTTPDQLTPEQARKISQSQLD